MKGFLVVLTVVISLLQQCQSTNTCSEKCGKKNNIQEFTDCVKDKKKCNCPKCDVFNNTEQRHKICKIAHCPAAGRRFQNLEPWQDDFEKKYDDTLIEKIFKRLNDDQHYF